MQDAFLDLRVLIHVASRNAEQIDLPSAEVNVLSGGPYKGEQVLASLQERNAVSIDGYGEEGFEGKWWMTSGPLLFACVTEEIDRIASLNGEGVLALEAEKDRVNLLVGFDLGAMRRATSQINEDIGRVAAEIERSPTLKPMQPMVADIAQHFVAVRAVLNDFEDVYRGILKPIQAEGRSGIKHTAAWAIIGIGVSTAISICLTLWAN